MTTPALTPTQRGRGAASKTPIALSGRPAGRPRRGPRPSACRSCRAPSAPSGRPPPRRRAPRRWSRSRPGGRGRWRHRREPRREPSGRTKAAGDFCGRAPRFDQLGKLGGLLDPAGKRGDLVERLALTSATRVTARPPRRSSRAASRRRSRGSRSRRRRRCRGRAAPGCVTSACGPTGRRRPEDQPLVGLGA